MYNIIFIAILYLLSVSSSGIYHENAKVTFNPEFDAELFGFSVVLTRFGLIVGAPKAMVKNLKTGAAFNCSLNILDSTDGLHPKTVSCNQVGPKAPNLQGGRSIIPNSFYQTDDMWFGATIASLSDGKTLYCAPRYTESFVGKHLFAHGECVTQRLYRNSLVYPLSAKGRQTFITDGKRREYGEYGTNLNFYAYGQAGMSVKVIGNSSVIIGAPGLLQWTGGIISFIYYPREESNYFSKQVISNPYYTPELGPDDYFGYSVEAGVFFPKADTLYVAGAPRSSKGLGQVLIFEPITREQSPLKIHAKLQGPQLGAYFGASLCCLDIDGDGMSDLLVGAPNYVVKDGGLPYDQGAVFVYMTKQVGNEFNLTNSGFVMGLGASGARFGTTIAELGDVDGDGFKDVAIGAPWENDGSGVVYIYRGSVNGLRSQYVQRIEAQGARSFGISISKGVDVDHNHCNDLAIGAALSNTTYLYRCVPTITVTTTIKVPDAMNLPHNATGFTALFCVSAPDKPQWHFARAEFKARIVIDPEGGRAKINETEDSEYNVSVAPGEERCDDRNVDVKPTADLSKPILIKFFLEAGDMLKNDSMVFNYHAGRVSEGSVLESSFLIQLLRDCGEDMICTPWLNMNLDPYEDVYTPGSNKKLGVKLIILNTAEPAYGARVNVTLPLIPKRIPNLCTLQDLVLTCDIPAPLFRDEEVFWDIDLEYKETSEEVLKIVAVLEDPLYNRNISKEPIVEAEVKILPIALFNVVGKSFPHEVIPVTRDEFNKKKEINFEHRYEIFNFGPSNWLKTEASITYPKLVGDQETLVNYTWNMPAKDTYPVGFPLKFRLSEYGELLEQNTTVNITTELRLTNIMDGNSTARVTTTLVLDPAPPVWPLIVGIVAGLIVLAAIVYLMYKFGFFSRQQRERLKQLKDGQTVPLTESEPDAGCSSGPPSIDANESTNELLYDSD